MSQVRRGVIVAVLAGTTVLGGCATRGQLQRGLAEQSAALEAERAARMAGDQQLAGNVRRVEEQMAANISALRTDLAAMDSEYGAKLTQLEQGLQLAIPVHFGFDRADVRAEADPILDRFASLIHQHYPGATITVEGFTDPAGSAEYNRRLAQRRAEAVRRELVARGIPDNQLRAVGYGAERPVVPNAAGSAHGAELNRRVVFVIETPSEATPGPSASR